MLGTPDGVPRDGCVLARIVGRERECSGCLQAQKGNFWRTAWGKRAGSMLRAHAQGCRWHIILNWCSWSWRRCCGIVGGVLNLGSAEKGVTMRAKTLWVENWKWTASGSQHGGIRFTPTVGTLGVRLLFTALLALIAFGLWGLQRVAVEGAEGLRYSTAEIEQLKRGYDHQLAVERKARGEAAEGALRQQLYGAVDQHVAKRNADADQRRAQLRVAVHALNGGVVGLATWGVLLPVSLLWRQASVRREGRELVFRQRSLLGLPGAWRVDEQALTRTRAVVQQTRFTLRRNRHAGRHVLTLTLDDGRQTVQLCLRKAATPEGLYGQAERLFVQMKAL